MTTNSSMANRSSTWSRRAAVAAPIAGALAVVAPSVRPADAHCASVEGPVVAAARKSLDSGDVKFVLAYVQPDSAAELTAAFRQARDVRRQAPAARALADRCFSETAVRLHRAGEGAPYTGLKTNPELGPALEAAEKAVATGKQGATQEVIVKALGQELDQRWHAIEYDLISAAAHAPGEVADAAVTSTTADDPVGNTGHNH
jgi:hypothetical protein